MSSRRRLARWRVQARRPTSFLRALPDFLIVGTQRGGTSSLYKYLGQHPEVSPSTRKEVEFFSTRFDAGVEWYRAHFPLRRRSGRLHTFEATPDYLLHPLAAERAYRLLPEAKIIAMLREPTSRAFSHYNHNRRLGHEPLSFTDALAAEPERIAGERARLLADSSYRALDLRRHGYVERGKYDEQLPEAIVVDVGATVTWTNHDDFTHNVSFPDEEALLMRPGESVTRSFPTADTFDYVCSLHPRDMTGTVTVGG